MSLEGPRILDKIFARATIENSVSEPFTYLVTGDQWHKVTDSSFVTRSYYDLSGYNWQDLTAFFAGSTIQEEFGPNGNLSCYVVDLITTEFLTDADISQAHFNDPAGTADLPGFPESTFDMSQVIYGRTRTFNATLNPDPASPIPEVSQYYQTNWGTCQAATSNKVHITRIVFTDFSLPVDSRIYIPPCDYVTSIIVAKEKELTYLMRQKRSYELAT